MEMRDLVKGLNFGSSVAEFDDALERYFVETDTFRAVVKGDADIVAGDKGTGKTALFKILRRRYASIPELAQIEVITGFNPTGNPVFQRLAQQDVLSEGQYGTVWKAYILSLVGNWLLDLYEGGFTASMGELEQMLSKTGLRSADDTAQTVFSKIMNVVSRFLHPKAAGVELTFSETGIPIVTPKMELGDNPKDAEVVEEISHENALGLLNKCLLEAELSAWVVLDRLDEAFQGFPDTEIPALRALLRTYLDLLEFEHVKLKIFVRRDLFRKITHGGFVNLTHVNARKIEIVWDEDDLRNLLCRRIRGSNGLIEALGVENGTDEEVFAVVFPEQVDVGARRPTTWNWMMSRIRDGNHVKPPRNLIDLVSKAREAQLRREDRESREFTKGTPVIEGESMHRALARLSAERVEDTLLAEAGDSAGAIDEFRGGKAEHNATTLKAVLGVGQENLKVAIQPLVELGFLEQTGETWKIPILYRDGLEITQGKAF
jgi:hypothetical protein